jgi:hypothetical protein
MLFEMTISTRLYHDANEQEKQPDSDRGVPAIFGLVSNRGGNGHPRFILIPTLGEVLIQKNFSESGLKFSVLGPIHICGSIGLCLP